MNHATTLRLFDAFVARARLDLVAALQGDDPTAYLLDTEERLAFDRYCEAKGRADEETDGRRKGGFARHARLRYDEWMQAKKELFSHLRHKEAV